jgi:glutaredoxin/glutathione-dependent peroxiredoxin
MSMTIQTGERFPETTFTRMTENGPAPVTSGELFAGKKVVLFGVPGAFTPTCSTKHLPGYVAEWDTMKAKGVDLVACMAVNDVFVMDAWGKAHGAAGKVLMLADGNGDVTRALGLEADFSKYGMGQRSQRFSLIVEDGVVRQLNVEAAGELKVSSAEATACQL